MPNRSFATRWRLPYSRAGYRPSRDAVPRRGEWIGTLFSSDLAADARVLVGVLAIASGATLDITTSASVSVGVQSRSAPTADVSASSSALVGVKPQSATAIAAWSVTSNALAGVLDVAGARPEPSAVSSSAVGVLDVASARPEPNAATRAAVGVLATSASARPEPSATTVARVGVADMSTPRPELSFSSTARVGVFPNSVPGADTDVPVVGNLFVGVQSRASASADVSATSVAQVGVTDVSTVRPEPSATSAARVGVQPSSVIAFPDATVTAGVQVGIAALSSPAVDVSTSSTALVGVLPTATPLVSSDTTVSATAYVGVHVRPRVTSGTFASITGSANQLVGVRPRAAPTANVTMSPNRVYVGVQPFNTELGVEGDKSVIGRVRVGVQVSAADSTETTTSATVLVGVRPRAYFPIEATANILLGELSSVAGSQAIHTAGARVDPLIREHRLNIPPPPVDLQPIQRRYLDDSRSHTQDEYNRLAADFARLLASANDIAATATLAAYRSDPLVLNQWITDGTLVLPPGGVPNVADWGWQGIVAPATDSLGTPWYPPLAGRLTAITIAAQTAPNVAYTIHTLVNGGAVAVTTLAIGQTLKQLSMSVLLGTTDKVQPKLLAVPSGTATSLSVLLTFVAT